MQDYGWKQQSRSGVPFVVAATGNSRRPTSDWGPLQVLKPRRSQMTPRLQISGGSSVCGARRFYGFRRTGAVASRSPQLPSLGIPPKHCGSRQPCRRRPTKTQGAYFWLAATINAIYTGNAGVASSLVQMARAKAHRLDEAQRKSENITFQRWLNGEGPKGVPPSKRAFQYMRGVSGWARSPKGAQALNDETPDQFSDAHDTDLLDAVDAEGLGHDAKAIRRIWGEPSAASVPLCDQAAVEQEANSWAELWNEGAQYTSTGDLMRTSPLVHCRSR